MGESIAAFEASPEVSPFSSKFDAFLASKTECTATERHGYDLFKGQAKCTNCHVVDGKPPLLTDNTTANLGVPRNPALAYYKETHPDEFGYIVNPAGEAALDLGVGTFAQPRKRKRGLEGSGAAVRRSFPCSHLAQCR